MPIDRHPVTASGAPAAVGPYVHAVRSGGLLFCSGQLGLEPNTGELVGPSAGQQAARCLKNLAAVCDGAGARLSDAVRINIYVTDISTFSEINEAYSLFFEVDPPARVTIGVAALPLDARVEMDAVIAVG